MGDKVPRHLSTAQTLSNLHGTGTITPGTGALAGLHGTLIFTDQDYSGILHNHPGGAS
jgi:hypothetical protein